MIRELTGRRRLFSPRRLINELVKWVLGVHSPGGTIKVNNTANPGERSLALDIDMQAVLSAVDKHDEGKGLSKAQREESRDVVRSCLDGNSLVWGDNCACVNSEWLDKYLDESGQEATLPAPDAGTPTALLSGVQPSGGGAGDNTSTFTASGSGNGVKCLQVTRSYSNGGVTYLFFREFTYAADGRVCAISGEVGSVGVYSV